MIKYMINVQNGVMLAWTISVHIFAFSQPQTANQNRCVKIMLILQEVLRQQREEAARRLGNDTAMEAARQAAILRQEQAQIRGHDSPPKTVSYLSLIPVVSFLIWGG